MIAHLKGHLISTGLDHAIIDVGGVGYRVSASTRTLAGLGPAGEAVTVHTEMLVGDDFIRLVGFGSAGERDWFRLLTGVQGVGARVALAILSALDGGELHRAIVTQDKSMVTRANGVGPKLAERIVRELKDKTGLMAGAGATSLSADGLSGAASAVPSGASGLAADALSALTSLGFKPAEASSAVAAAEAELEAATADITLDALVRLALRKAAR